MFKLLESNPQLTEIQGYYKNQRQIFRDSKLDNQVQVVVSDIFERASEKSLFGLGLETLLVGDASRRALASAPFNYLQAFDFSQINNALDLSEDFGGVAHYLANQVNWVESVKVDQDLARLTVRRCVNQRNVRVLLEDIDKLNFPAGQFDLIVLGQLDNHDLDENQLAALLTKLRASLTERGVLVINVQNRNRFSVHHCPTPYLNPQGPDYADLYLHQERGLNSQAIELTEARRMIHNCGFAHLDIHGTFSQGNDFANLFSHDYLTASVDPLNHFYRISTAQQSDLNEFLAYRQLFNSKQPLINVASRYLLVLGSSSKHTRRLYDNDFTHFAGSGRKPAWRANTARSRANPVVRKTKRFESIDQPNKLIEQDLSDQPFKKGYLLVNDWLDTIIDSDGPRLHDNVSEYFNWLKSVATDSEQFSREAYDALPFNILVTAKGDERHFALIDKEWVFKSNLSPEFVLFRALFWFAFENKPLLRRFAIEQQLFSVGAFIAHFFPGVQSIDELTKWAELEEAVQAEIDADFSPGSVTLALEQSFTSTLSASESTTTAQVVWINESGATLKRSLTSAIVEKQPSPQKVRFLLNEFDPDFAQLRVDPISCRGSFELLSITLKDKDDAVIHTWSRKSLQSLSSIENAHILDQDTPAGLWIALNDDPYLILDDASLPKSKSGVLTKGASLEVELNWLWDERYSKAITSLSDELARRNAALMQQLQTINTLDSENRYQQSTIDDLRDHRRTLMGYEQDQEKRALAIQAHVSHLREALNQQREKNDLLYTYLLARPSTRLKAFISRIVKKILRRPIYETNTDVFKPPEPAPEPTPWEELIGQNTEDYDLWIRENDLTAQQLEAASAEIETMDYKPVFSILVPIYNTAPEYLIPMIRSVQAQIYPHWQLCLVDDCSPKSYLRSILEHEAAQDSRISIRLNDVNQGISVTTNDALEMATGDYIALLDHDDEISVDALYHNAKAINANPKLGLIYSDEDKMDMQGARLEPYFKPDYSQDLLETNNYICHFTVIKKSIMDELGGFREGLDGSQDHDIILRAADAAEAVHHIPRILYHWRKIPGSTAVVYDSKSYAWEAGRKSVEDLLRKRETGVRVEFGSLKGTYRVFREIKGEPLISIVIPFKDKPELLKSCIESILNRSSYSNIEIIGVSNNSELEQTQQMMQRMQERDSRVSFVEHNVPFNFSAICNFGVAQANGDYIVLLNNDIEIISSDWLERLLEHAQRPEIGAVGGKLLYPDGRIQHAGIVVGMVGAAGHPHKFFPDNHIGYHGRLHMVYNVSAVTGAMLMVSRKKYDEVGGLNDQELAVAYNDVDFCLKLMQAGYTNLFTPHCKATHHESVSRGYEDTPEKLARLKKEQQAFLSLWNNFLEQGDPFYNPNLSLKNEKFSLNFRD